MDIKKHPFLKRWLLHSLILWLSINILSLLFFWYQTRILQYSFLQEVTVWEKLTTLNVVEGAPLLILLVLLIIEINHEVLFTKSVWLFMLGAFIAGFLGSIIPVLYKLNAKTFHASSLLQPALVIASYAFIYPLLLDFINKRIFKAERLYEKSRAELNALKAQLQPHFLFNTLNNLYGTALAEDARQTAQGIESMAALMRYVLSEAHADFVPISYELQFLKEYIGLHRIRLSPSANEKVKVHIEDEARPCMIAPLLIIPFVENAFKYGLSIDKDCFIDLSLTIENAQLQLRIVNSIASNDHGAGTGIENARRRLSLLYPKRHSLELMTTDSSFTVELQLQLD